MEPTSDTTAPPPIHMVVGYDFSDNSRIGLERAILLARAEPDHILHVLAVLDDKLGASLTGRKGRPTYDDTAALQDSLTQDIEARLSAIGPEGAIHFFIHVRLGSPAEELLRLAEEVGAHLILVGSHGRTGLRRMLLGSVSETVVRQARCPVLVVRERGYQDVTLEPVTEAPEGHAEERPYVPPHRYAYRDSRLEKQSSAWPLY